MRRAALALVAALTISLVSPLGSPAGATIVATRCPAHYAPGTTVSSARSYQVVLAVRTSGHIGWWHRYQFRESGCRWQMIAYGHAVFGINGTVPAAQRVHDSGQTPAGTFPLQLAFGVRNPGTRLPYATITPSIWWDGRRDSPTYNRMLYSQHGCDPVNCEHFIDDVPPRGYLYTQGVLIGYNSPYGTTKPVVREGGGSGAGIFLHWAHYYTEGCVGITELDRLTALVKWLNPAQHPTIVVRAS